MDDHQRFLALPSEFSAGTASARSYDGSETKEREPDGMKRNDTERNSNETE